MPDAAVKKKRRPLWLNVSLLNLPIPGIVSILHRISGAVLFLALPWLLFLFDGSLASEERYEAVRRQLAHPIAQLAVLGLVWAYAHHWTAGLRHLLLDLHIGIDLPSARASARATLAISIALTLLFGWALLW